MKYNTKRKQLVDDLSELDFKLKFTSKQWNEEVNKAFNRTGSFCFEALVSKDQFISTTLRNEFAPYLLKKQSKTTSQNHK